MALRIRVLGRTRAERDGDEVDLAGPRPAQLLALLAAAEGRAVDAGSLAEQLWRGRPPATAATTLQGHVARLRRRLEPGAGAREAGVLRTVGAGYALRLPRTSVDAHRFEDLVHAGHAAAEQGRAEDAVRLLAEALTGWRPDPYADVADVDEVVPVVARLEELRLRSVERLAALRLDAGHAEVAAADLAAVVAEQPLRESTSDLLARALYRAGRQADALDVLRRLRRRLDDELGLDPTPRLQALEQALLRQDPALDGRPPTTAPAGAPTTASTGAGDQPRPAGARRRSAPRSRADGERPATTSPPDRSGGPPAPPPGFVGRRHELAALATPGTARPGPAPAPAPAPARSSS